MRHLIFPIIAALLLPTGATAAPIDEVRAHLASTSTMTADFRQTAANGAIEAGRLALKRPGRVRFQYRDAPMLIVADGHDVKMIDYEVSQVTSWPIRGTPLAVLLDPSIDLARFARVLPSPGQSVRIEARDPKHPEYGVTTLDFERDSAAPGGLRLRSWHVLDAQGNNTRVDLMNVRFNSPIDSSQFRFRDPRPRIVPGKG